jgi:hypothetical protein
MRNILAMATIAVALMGSGTASAALRGQASGAPACPSPATLRQVEINMRAGNYEKAQGIMQRGGCITLRGLVNVDSQGGGMVCARPFGGGSGCYWTPSGSVSLGY